MADLTPCFPSQGSCPATPIHSVSQSYTAQSCTDHVLGQTHQTSADIQPLPNKLLKDIPDEVWCLILESLPVAQLAMITRVCGRWRHMIQHDLTPFWKALAVQCQLGEPQSLIHTHRELVLGHTLLICELCLGRSEKGVGSALPLPVAREDAIGRTWMCRPCRKRYYERFPEPTRPSQPADYDGLRCGSGYMMCSAPVLCVPSSSLEPTLSLEQSTSSGVQPSIRAVPLTTIPLNSSYCLEHTDEVGRGIVLKARRHHGGDIGIEAHHSTDRINALLRPRRRKIISTRLGLLGLSIRSDSKLCGRYLMGAKDDVFRIAEIMREMQWYYDQTSYACYIEDEDSAGAKAAALMDWIKETVGLFGTEAKEMYKRPLDPALGSGGLKEVDGDCVLVEREPPPQSLWPVLDEWLEEWQHGNHLFRPASSTFGVNCAVDGGDNDD